MSRNTLHITGAWTKAGVVSCVRVRGDERGNDILFDCGVIDEGVMSAKVSSLPATQ